jgi:hypothetical protein
MRTRQAIAEQRKLLLILYCLISQSGETAVSRCGDYKLINNRGGILENRKQDKPKKRITTVSCSYPSTFYYFKCAWLSRLFSDCFSTVEFSVDLFPILRSSVCTRKNHWQFSEDKPVGPFWNKPRNHQFITGSSRENSVQPQVRNQYK